MVYIHNVLCYDMELKVFLYRLSMALVLGALIGVERQIKQRSAGLTTNALVALGACTFILISESVSRAGMTDNVRVLAQVVTGILNSQSNFFVQIVTYILKHSSILSWRIP